MRRTALVLATFAMFTMLAPAAWAGPGRHHRRHVRQHVRHDVRHHYGHHGRHYYGHVRRPRYDYGYVVRPRAYTGHCGPRYGVSYGYSYYGPGVSFSFGY